jgi:molecular chaperone DnaK
MLKMKPNNDSIRIGIDLGTTNSEIAINQGLSVEVINNSEGSLYTPSVVGFNRKKNLVIGKEAYDQLFKSASSESNLNYQAEVKRKMGLDEKIIFGRSEKSYSPEEISAEILKVLKNDLLRRYPEISTHSAVITIPMAFATVQSEATKRAGELAGFDHVVILQEPIAAAIAYGLKNNQNENWLVYDLGGGTFDVALISSKDGLITVIEHGGNNYLGGKDFDELLIQEVFKKKILEKYRFKNLNLSIKDEKYGVTYCHLKAIAESAKIKLSTLNEVDVEIIDVKMGNPQSKINGAKDLDFVDDKGEMVDLSFKLLRSEYEKLIASKIDETIQLSKKVITDSNIKAESISKIILVGAPTLTPIIRHRLFKELGIKVDSSMNPFTVVAEGAAIFALSQKVPQEILDQHREISKEEIRATINVETMTSDVDVLVTGSVNLKNKGDFFVKISSDSGHFNSQKIKLTNNSFSVYVSLEKQKQNLFWVYLIDGKGNNLNVYPNSFSITQGMTLSGAPIPHEIGVIYSEKQSDGNWKEKCFKYFERKSTLPLTKSSSFKTIQEVARGETVFLPIEVYEGDFDDPKLNQVVTKIEIDGNQLPFTLKKGSEVDIKIDISESRELTVEVYIPEIDLELNARVNIYNKKLENSKLIMEIDQAEKESEELEENIDASEKASIRSELGSIKTVLENKPDDETKQKVDNQIKQIQKRLQTIKDSTSYDRVLKEYEDTVSKIEKELSDLPSNAQKTQFSSAFDKIQQKAVNAIELKQEDRLEIVIQELEQLNQAIVTSSPQYWVGFLMFIMQRKASLKNPTLANTLIEQAKKAIDDDDVDGLKQSVIELARLLPKESSAELQQKIAGITK